MIVGTCRSSCKSPQHIKKHGSEIFLSPSTISPHQHLESSNHLFGSLNKPVVEHPYELAGIKGFAPPQPWVTAKAALATTEPIDFRFPTVEELDDEIDSWPESINPFKSTDDNPCSDSDKVGANGHLEPNSIDHTVNFPIQAAITHRSIDILVNEMIKSENKLYFISYCIPNATRREWKLIQINLDLSMKKHSTCLQDGIFLAEFYVFSKAHMCAWLLC